uniref:Secreted protein n=1 Tax=Clastoptera arizonana TaxID=38151 RepID=A0A1B6E7F6_9HEMI
MNILIKLFLISISVNFSLTLPFKSANKEDFDIANKTIEARECSTANGKIKGKNSAPLSLWDVDTNLMKKVKRQNPRRKRFNLNEPLKKTRKDLKKSNIKEVKLKARKDKKEKRSFDAMSMVCSKTDTGVRCLNNNTQILFNPPGISEDVIKEGVRVLMTNGAFDFKGESKKKARACEERTTCSTAPPAPTTCEETETPNGCIVTEEYTPPVTTEASCHKKLADLLTECFETTTCKPTPTGCNAHIHLRENAKMKKRESFGPNMFLECLALDGENGPLFSCRWKKKSETG